MIENLLEQPAYVSNHAVNSWLLVTSSSLLAPLASRLHVQATVPARLANSPMMLMRERVGLMQYTSPYDTDVLEYGMNSNLRRGSLCSWEQDLEDDAFRHGDRYMNGRIGGYGGYGMSRYGGYGMGRYGGSMSRYGGYGGYGMGRYGRYGMSGYGGYGMGRYGGYGMSRYGGYGMSGYGG